MKFRIRFADQIVGFFIIFALVALVFVIFMLGSRQRWFANDHKYKTYFDTAAGIAVNMMVQYKGFTIGTVKSFRLTEDDEVEVIFSVYNEYGDRVRQGSLVDLEISPIGLGNHFYFYPGLGEDLIEEGGHVPNVQSPQGQTLIQLGLAKPPVKTDSISNLLAQVDGVLGNLNGALTEVQDAITGTDATTLGRTLGGVEETIAGLKGVTGNLNESLAPILADVKGITSDLETLTGKLAEPDGFVSTLLDTDGAVYTSLEASLKSIAGTLRNLEKTTDYLPAQMPQILGLVTELRITLETAQDVLTALLNNPLLKKGVPERARTQSSGTNPRDVRF
jgi:phospholipid/cholesterol/gamma-HCH transport system substrate-binding protein